MCFVLIAKARVPERNVAIEKPAIQSSTFNVGYAWKAVDGNLTTSAPTRSCTLADLHSWWAVDLLERFLVKEVKITTDQNVVLGNLSLYIFCTIYVTRKPS